jgi:hypothetical protein
LSSISATIVQTSRIFRNDWQLGVVATVFRAPELAKSIMVWESPATQTTTLRPQRKFISDLELD